MKERNTGVKEISKRELAQEIFNERIPNPEDVIYPLTIDFLDNKSVLTREEMGRIIAMGDRTARSYATLTTEVLQNRGNVDSTPQFYLMYALSARGSNEISHTSILEQIGPGRQEKGGDSPIILEGVSILTGLRDICSLRHFGFEAFSSRGGIFPKDYWRIPKEISESSVGKKVKYYQGQIYEKYKTITKAGIEYYLGKLEQKPDEKNWAFRWRVLNYALDDARQVTNGAFLNHLSMHPNSALSLRDAVVELSSSDNPETQEVANKLRDLGKQGLPTLMEFTDPSPYTQSLNEKAKNINHKLFGNQTYDFELKSKSEYLGSEISQNPEIAFLSAFLASRSSRSYSEIYANLALGTEKNIEVYIKQVFSGITLHDKPPRELEMIQINSDLMLPVGAVYELIRHRLATHIVSKFSHDHGYTIPNSIKEMHMENEYTDAIKLNELMYDLVASLGDRFKDVYGPYFVARANIVPVTVRFSGADAFHLLKLRASSAAHPDISGPMYQMEADLKAKCPNIFNHLVKKQNG